MIKSAPWFDLDGVLVDASQGFAEVFGVDYPTSGMVEHDWILRAAGITPMEFMTRMDQLPMEFWRDLEPLPWTADLVQFLDLEFESWHIVSHAVWAPSCWHGKAEWVRRFLGRDYLSRLHLIGYGSTKASLATPGAMLVDDRGQNCVEWSAAGGRSFHWRPFVATDPMHGDVVRECKAFLLGGRPGWT
jgi:hypothetical protein